MAPPVDANTTRAPTAQRRLQHVDRAGHVDRRVGGRVGHRQAHVGLRGEMEDHVRAVPGDDGGERGGVADVGLREVAVDAFAAALREIVERQHVVAACGQRVDQVGADEPGAAGDDRPHYRPITTSTAAGAMLSGEMPSSGRTVRSAFRGGSPPRPLAAGACPGV